LHIRYDSVQGLGARESQQDSFGVEQLAKDRFLAIVADGMGGLVNSDQVSKIVVKTIMESYAPNETVPASHQLMLLLQRALHAVQELTADATYESGTTLVSCIIGRDGLSWISVGDSRICLWRKGGLIQLNRDHDFARDLAIMTLNGTYTLEEITKNPRRDALTSYIGRDVPRYVDFNAQPVHLEKGDKIILMTDGIYRALSEVELAKILKKNPERATKQLKKAVLRKAFSQQDNFTAVVIGV